MYQTLVIYDLSKEVKQERQELFPLLVRYDVFFVRQIKVQPPEGDVEIIEYARKEKKERSNYFEFSNEKRCEIIQKIVNKYEKQGFFVHPTILSDFMSLSSSADQLVMQKKIMSDGSTSETKVTYSTSVTTY